ncbi:MAG: hypothetical protein MPN21_15795 [Thermoanaerobaculia bacterium]|nr:hypothetical protein [Thermoanaerobaculia bacterium]
MWTIDRIRIRSNQSLVVLWLVFVLPSVVSARPFETPAEEQLERLRSTLQAWSHGQGVAHDQVKAIFSVKNDPRDSTETSCIRSVESDLSGFLESKNPSLLLPLTFWQTQMLLQSTRWSGAPLHALDFDRIFDRLKAYQKRAAKANSSLAREQTERNTALAWTGVAELFAGRGNRKLESTAEKMLLLALDIDEDLLAARYLLAWVGEKIHEPLDVMRPWRELMDEYPRKPEFRLRYALNAAGASRTRSAIEELERVARSDGDEWIRALAYEEWVQLLLEESRGTKGRAAAREILEESRRALPSWPGLDVLASYLDLEGRRGEALHLAERVEAHLWPEFEVSPRLRYELPNPAVIGPARSELIEELTRGMNELSSHLRQIEAEQVLRPRSRRACRG